jgi:hypothetical protein
MLDPDVYPLNLACWDGRVTEHWQEEEHALDKPSRPTAAPVVVTDSTPPEAANKESKPAAGGK